MFQQDVFVLGGGPAGLAAAIAVRQAGLRVVVVDADHPPIDKACGEGLMPDSLAAAASLGIHVHADLGFPFQGIRFRSADHTVVADFPQGKGLGVRRPVLHRLLVERAQELGVEMRWGSPVSRIDSIRARWIIGADGAQSSVRRWAGLDSFRRDGRRFGFRRHYRVTPWSQHVEIHWGNGCQFYVTPVSANEICLVLMSRDPHLRIADGLPRFPFLEAQLAGCHAVTQERGSLAATRRLSRVTRGNIALIGDASGTVDPITGEGICISFHQAVALVEALKSGDLNLYECAHAQITRRSRFMADFMLLLDRSTLLRARALAALEAHPQLFDNLLAMHVGHLKPARFVATAAHLGWEVLFA
jgi:flavin-dependent dehydrogenase